MKKTANPRPHKNVSSSEESQLFDELKVASKKVQNLFNKMLGSGYNVGVLYKAARHLTSAGGKMLRPYLVLSACDIVGGREEDALPSAAAVELLHTFTLIHDDIMDNDKVRRGVQTVHTRWNMPIAILAGDLLFAKVYQAITQFTDPSKVSPKKIVRTVNTLADVTIKICEGQEQDMAFSTRERVTEEEYIEMISKKTSNLFKASAEIGGIVGGGSEEQIKRLGFYAYYSGIAFQIVDDVLGLVADEKKLGKPVGSDIREGKKTLPIIHALQNLPPQQRKRLIQLSKSKNQEATQLKKLIVSAGSIHYAMNKARRYNEKAIKQLEIFSKCDAKNALINFSKILVSRNF
ncbi:MAG: polyprenyl synthetase family protein [Candidatus Bathyarchaeota archaeon]